MTAHIQPHVEAALRNLTPVWAEGDDLMLSVPVSYPSGALVSVSVSGGREEIWISDRGFGRYESEMCAAEPSFASAAKQSALRFGVKFDGHSIFAMRLPIAQLAGGIVAVANASATAAAESIRAEATKRAEMQNELIQSRLRQAFPDASISRKASIAGERAEWDAHNVVRIGDRLAVFEPVTSSPQSISSKFLMFSDLSRRPNISLNAVADDVSKLGSKGLMLADVAHLMDAGAPASSYRAMAEAA